MGNIEDRRKEIFGASPPQQVTVNTSPGGVSANQISIDFHTPSGNEPSSFSNTVFIWQSGNIVPWQSAAKNSKGIPNDSPSGSVSFDGLDVTTLSYIIGYSVGPKTPDAAWSKYANVVATVYVPAIGEGNDPSKSEDNSLMVKPSVTVQTLGSTSLVAGIFLPPGYNPVASGTWVGIWEGGSAYYSSSMPPKWFEASQRSSGDNTTVSFNNIMLTRGTQYTLGLFATGYSDQVSKLKQTALAATYSFSV